MLSANAEAGTNGGHVGPRVHWRKPSVLHNFGGHQLLWVQGDPRGITVFVGSIVGICVQGVHPDAGCYSLLELVLINSS